MKKVLVVLLVLMCAMTCVFAGCDFISKPQAPKTQSVNEVLHTIALQSATALQSAETMDVLPEAPTNDVVDPVETPVETPVEENVETPVETQPQEPAETPVENQPQEDPALDNSLANKIIDIIPNADLLTAMATKLTVKQSDREGYKYRVELNYGLVDCVVYMEDVITEEEREIEEDDDEEEAEEEVEITNKYKGIIVFNGNEYAFKGETKIETEGNEREEELTLKIQINENSYIFINQEFEVEDDEKEESFKYRFYVNKEIVEEYKISKEVEGDKGSLKIVKNGEVFKYKYYVKDEAEYIQIINDTLTEVYQKVLNADGTYSYVEEQIK